MAETTRPQVKEVRSRHVNENKEIEKLRRETQKGRRATLGRRQTERATTWKSERRKRERKRK